MFDALTRLLRGRRPPRFGGVLPAEYRPGTPIPFVAPEDLLVKVAPELADLRNSWRLELELFDDRMLPLVRRCAELMQAFPASAADHHAVLGGLLSHSIDTAARCLRLAQRPLSPDLVGRKQADAERGWYVIAAVAGLLHDAAKPLTDFEIHAEVPGARAARECPHYQGGPTLYAWGREHAPTGRYVWLWAPGRGAHRHVTERATASLMLLDQDLWRWLGELYPAGSRMLRTWLENDQSSVLKRLVTDADHDSVRAYVDRVAGVYTQTTRTDQVLALAIERMRLWVRTGGWKVNEPGAAVWHTTAGTFVGWQQPAAQLVKRLRDEGHDDIPEPAALAKALLHRHWLVPGADPTTGMPTETVRLWLDPILVEGPVVAVHLRSPTSLFDHGAIPEVVQARLEPPGFGLVSGALRLREPVDRSGDPVQADLFPASGNAALGGAEEGVAVGRLEEPPSDDDAIAGRANDAALDRLRGESAAPPARFPSTSPRPRARRRNAAAAPDPAVARQTVLALGDGGRLLLSLLEDVLAGRRRWGEVLFRRGDRVAIGYPGPLAHHGDPVALMELLERDGLLVVDPLHMSLVHRDPADGGQWLCLRPFLIEPVLALVGDVASGPRSHERVPMPAPEPAPEPPSAAAPPATAASRLPSNRPPSAPVAGAGNDAPRPRRRRLEPPSPAPDPAAPAPAVQLDLPGTAAAGPADEAARLLDWLRGLEGEGGSDPLEPPDAEGWRVVPTAQLELYLSAIGVSPTRGALRSLRNRLAAASGPASEVLRVRHRTVQSRQR